ncbi:hypothetical protein N8G13_00620 [Mycoplasma zalophi]|uniref:thermonuclease family protein n=1 Tax=Mycoplasma zalophi TaxID=191287 RepID=UPI0021C6BF41|nr:hypothetical protein [Mycoplasma zalophi]MCU4116967.1 hypothetical protein [Mycoplasma zalophi]
MKFKKIKNKLILSTLAISAFVCFLTTAVSCSYENKDKESSDRQFREEIKLDFDENIGKKLNETITVEVWEDFFKTKKVKKELTYWEQFKPVEGTVVQVYDGDTYLLEYKDESGNVVSQKIRSWGIDTPETKSVHTPNVSDLEQEYSDRDTEHAKSLILGKAVRTYFFPSGSTYDRRTGITFFGDNFEKCFEFQMLKDGFTLSRMTLVDINSFKSEYSKKQKDSIPGLFLKDFAYAANHAVLNNKAFYEKFKTPLELQEAVYGSHGDVLSRFMYLPSLLNNREAVNEENNIFKFLEKNNK